MRGLIVFGVGAYLCLTTVGCGKPVIDTSTDQTMERSIEEVRASLPVDQRKEFDQALQTIAIEEMGIDGGLAAALTGQALPDPEVSARRVKDKLSGRTAVEILAMAEEIEAESEAKAREEGLKKIAELEERKAEAEAARRQLESFEVLRSRFWREPQRWGGPEPRIRLTVRNGTAHPVARAFFRGTLQSPGRSVPWLHEEFNYQIAGGLEPGEEATWTLVPNSFSVWGTTAVPAEAVLHVEVTKLEGPNEVELFSTFGFGPADEEQLRALRAEFQ